MTIRKIVKQSKNIFSKSNSHIQILIKITTNLHVEESTSLSAQELANLVNISVLLAKERLLLTESVGGVCRDDSDEGLRFFPNLFLTKVV